MYKRVLVGTDLSSTAAIAVDRAAALARMLGAELIVLHAGGGGPHLQELAATYGARAIAVAGSPPEVLMGQAVAHAADLIVVGSVGMSGARRFLLGSVPNKVSHHATTDVLIVKTDPPRGGYGYRRILVGTDGSPTAMRAVEMAAELGSQIPAMVTVVCVYEPLTQEDLEQLRGDPGDPVVQWSAARDVRDIPDEFRWRIAGAAHAEDVLDRAAERARRAGVSVEVRALEGNPAQELIGFAEEGDFDMIAVGSVGMSGARRFMLGNVPDRVSHQAPTDVLILQTT